MRSGTKKESVSNLESRLKMLFYMMEKIIGIVEDIKDRNAVILYLGKAFKSIPNEVFLKKAEVFNLSQSKGFLIIFFFAYRTQCVKMGFHITANRNLIIVFHKGLRSSF